MSTDNMIECYKIVHKTLDDGCFDSDYFVLPLKDGMFKYISIIELEFVPKDTIDIGIPYVTISYSSNSYSPYIFIAAIYNEMNNISLEDFINRIKILRCHINHSWKLVGMELLERILLFLTFK